MAEIKHTPLKSGDAVALSKALGELKNILDKIFLISETQFRDGTEDTRNGFRQTVRNAIDEFEHFSTTLDKRFAVCKTVIVELRGLRDYAFPSQDPNNPTPPLEYNAISNASAAIIPLNDKMLTKIIDKK